MMRKISRDGARAALTATLTAARTTALTTARTAALALCLAGGLSLAGAPAVAAGETGEETGLPLPRYVSLKASKANMRRGPSTKHLVDWVLVRRGMPLQVIGEYGHWRRVRDMEGALGWVHYSMLSGVRTAVTRPELTELREAPQAGAAITARAGPGVVLRLSACERAWCEVSAEGAEGWAPKDALWGVEPGETFD